MPHRVRILHAMKGALLQPSTASPPWHLSSTTRGAGASVPQYIVVILLDTTAGLRHNPRQQLPIPGELGSRYRPSPQRRYSQ